MDTTINPATADAPELAAPDPEAIRRGKQALTDFAHIGHSLTTAITEQLGPELHGNIPVLVLCELSLHGPRRPRDLMEATHLTSGGLTKVLDQLEAAGLIDRQFGTLSADRRASVITLTRAGAEAADRIGTAAASRFGTLHERVLRIARLLEG